MPQVKSQLFLAALSGIIVYSYNSILEPLVFGNDDITEAQAVNSNELALRRNLASRSLKQTDIDRILEVTQDNFPECMGCTETSNGGKECAKIKGKGGGGYMTHATYEHMTVYECLDFIEQFIYENYSAEDRYVRAVIKGERSGADFWSNSAVIEVSDNDIVIGRDDDGIVHFDFDWNGSGEKVTPEQEQEIPPIHSIETDEGYAQAAAALPDETVYAPEGAGFAVAGGDSSNVQAGKSKSIDMLFSIILF